LFPHQYGLFPRLQILFLILQDVFLTLQGLFLLLRDIKFFPSDVCLRLNFSNWQLRIKIKTHLLCFLLKALLELGGHVFQLTLLDITYQNGHPSSLNGR
jgi:hypothetical protein